ncbi:E3 ubiquitin-protein ligase KEG [Cucumis sativus]|uniref:RING-type E3 ubiquitin transferase n=1 Tax=Cucumis sativus TaxID=3659 RepID=A0A0A0KEJ0_CUCSA|nr:E3 ubiquitin-protein ligase KEG [Cucumis sativus]KGN48095.1 hypothetical protein Csa_003030 [Cucumis sativus]
MPKKWKQVGIPSCSICRIHFDEDSRSPLLLQCGHTFCKHCLSQIIAPTSPKPSLTCPKCRHVSTIGNSVLSLPKNFAILPMISPASVSHSAEVTDSDDDDAGADEDGADESDRGRRSSGCHGCGEGFGDHELKLVRKIDGGKREEMELWFAWLRSRVGGCRHRVVVRRVKMGNVGDLDWVEKQLEKLRRASIWCRNVCSFLGVMKVEDYLCIVMDWFPGSVQSEMQRSGGRLTLEQILRFGADIARAVVELHAADVLCMNLKPSNFLLDANGHAVVSDYGLPLILKKPCHRAGIFPPEHESSRQHWCLECLFLSPHYRSPEAWEPLKRPLHLFRDDGIGISTQSDVWSFGCALVEMCTGSTPWAGLSTEEIYRSVVKEGKLPPQYASIVGVGIPRELWKMIGECLQYKPLKRPTFHAMLAVFLRHLQGIHRPPTRPTAEVASSPRIDRLEQSPTSVLDILQVKSNHLHQLVSEGDVNGVRDLLSKSASGNNSSSVISLLEAHNSEGQTALHLACRRGSPELVDAILDYSDADIDSPDENGNPPIVFALAVGSAECVRALIRKSANGMFRLMEGFGRSVAHVCAYYGQPDCMRELLQAGADPNAVDDNGESVLHVAIAKKFTPCAIVIMEHGGCKSMGFLNSKNLTPLHMCITSLNVDVVKRWVELASPEEISEAIDIPSSTGTALCMAAALKKDREIEGRELVRVLLKAKADPAAQDPQQCRTVLHTAAMANDVELVKIILNAGVDVNITNLHNTIPLHLALARGAKPCVQLLLSAGANCNLQDDDGDNAFHLAADAAKYIRECLDCILLILKYPGAAIGVRNHSGKTFCDLLEALPREWIFEELMDALEEKGIHLSPTIFQVGDWVKFKRCVTNPAYGWQGAGPRSVGFVQGSQSSDGLSVSFCSGVAHVLADEIIKVIPMDRGQLVQLKPDVREPRFKLFEQSRDSIGTVLCIDDEEGIIRIGFTGASRGFQADPADFQRLQEFKVGDWIRVRYTLPAAKHGFGDVTPGSIGVVYGIRPDSSLLIEFCYVQSPWLCEPEEIEPVVPFKIGDQVCVKRSISEPRYPWDGETHNSVGKVCDIESNGLLIIDLPNRHGPWKVDPSDMEKVDKFKVGDWVRVKTSVPSPKYGWDDVPRSSIGIIFSLEEDGDVDVAFCFRSKTFPCSVTDIEKVPPFEVGQEVHILPSVTQPLLGWSDETPASSGKLERIDMDGTLNVRVSGRKKLWRVAPGDAEKLSGLAVGDWVRIKQCLGARSNYESNNTGKENIAVVYSIQDYSYVDLASCFREGKFPVHCTEVEKIPPIKIGQYVHFRAGLIIPRWGWRGANPNSRGVVTAVNANGEIRVSLFGLSGWWRGDPADFEVEQMYAVGEWVKLKEDYTDGRKSLPAGSIGVVQGLSYQENEWDGSVLVGFCREPELWVGHTSKLEKTERFYIGQHVKVKPSIPNPRFGWSGHSHASIVSITAIDADGKIKVSSSSPQKLWILDPSEVVMVEEEQLNIGDWVKIKPSIVMPAYHWGDVTRQSVGVIHKMEDGELWVAFCFMEQLWMCKDSEMEKVRPFRVGDTVRFREGLKIPRWGWGMETHASKGQVVGVDANGKVRVRFRWREGRPWIGDPADLVLDNTT